MKFLDITSLAFDATSPESAQFTVAIPDTWDLGEISAEIHWCHASGATAFGVVWKIFAVFLADGSPILTAPNDASVTDVGGEANTLYVANRLAIDPAGDKALGGHVGIIIQRDAGAAGDTLDVDARLIGIRLFFGADKPNETRPQEFPTLLDPETIIWRDAITAAGGTFNGDSIAIADALIIAIKASTFNAKIVWLNPLLGGDIIAAKMPLRDLYAVGMMADVGSANFVNADFTQATGLQSNGTTKLLDAKLTPDQIGDGSGPSYLRGGIGYWERSFSTTGTDGAVFGCYSPAPDRRWMIDLRSDRQLFFFGAPAEGCGVVVAPGNAHYYGQAFSFTDRRLFSNGADVGGNSVIASGSSREAVQTIKLMGASNGATMLYHQGLCGVAYLTNGQLTTTEIADLHTLLTTYLIGPTGR